MRTLIQSEAKVKIASFDASSYKVSNKLKKSNFGLANKFYQKLFLILIATSTLLIFPESPKNSEVLCKKHYSIEACTVW